MIESVFVATRERGRAAWPEVDIEDAAWRAFLEERIPSDAATLDGLHVEDLWIVCACLGGDPHAMAAFDRTYRADIVQAARRTALASAADDVVQLAYTKLFVGDGRPRAIASYAGRGSLAGWLRMIVVRIALDQRRADNPEVIDDEILAWPDSREDPELATIRSRYGDAFKSAFVRAMDSLTPRERNVLRQQVVYRMTLDQIAKLHRVHRSAVARWLADARQKLLTATRDALGDHINANRAQVESLLALLHSQLDLSIERLLASKPER